MRLQLGVKPFKDWQRECGVHVLLHRVALRDAEVIIA
jgi:hypothetical protein